MATKIFKGIQKNTVPIEKQNRPVQYYSGQSLFLACGRKLEFVEASKRLHLRVKLKQFSLHCNSTDHLYLMEWLISLDFGKRTLNKF